MKRRNLNQVFRVACVCALSAFTSVPAQTLWHPIPTESSRTNDTDIVGAAVDAVATRGGLVAKARVVVSGQKRLGTALVGIWVEKLNTIVSDDDLWPYTGPPLGTETKNPHMIEITLVSSTGKFLYSSRLVMLAPESFPKGIADGDDENLFATNNGVSDERFKTLITKMNSGFDYGVVTIGRGVFSPPVVVKFPGNGVKGLLMPAMDSAKQKASDSRVTQP
jgi:hypothetical protein